MIRDSPMSIVTFPVACEERGRPRQTGQARRAKDIERVPGCCSADHSPNSTPMRIKNHYEVTPKSGAA